MTDEFKMEAFDFTKFKSLGDDGKNDYIKQCFIPLATGDHIVFDEDLNHRILDQQTVKKVYFNRMDKNANEFYFNKYTEIKTLVCELNKPMIYGNKFNVCPSIKAKYRPYNEFSDDIKTSVELFLLYIKEVLASDNIQSYEYILNWLANMLKGNKNDACKYLKGGQGIGKSTISDFLKENVIGTDLFLETGSSPLKNKFNSILQGKLLVQFSELENFNKNEWASVSSVLKRFITSTTYTLEGKNENSIQINNVNNYILDSNNDAIKDDEGRRYFIADVSHKYQNNRIYFGKIRNSCFNDEVGNAFYSLMLDRNIDGFIPQNYPETKNKLNALSKRLDSSYMFLKDEYVLKKKSIYEKPKELFDEYLTYCNSNTVPKIHKKMDFISKLSEINLNYYKTSGTHYFKISLEELKQIADKNKWIHELDEEQTEEEEENQPQITEEYVQSLLQKIKDLENKITELQNDDDDDIIGRHF